MRNRVISKFLILNLIFAFLILLFYLPSAYAWKLPIEVSTFKDDGEKVYSKLVIGIESGATDGFDNLWDTPAMFSHPDSDNGVFLKTYLDGSPGVADRRFLWKDIRGVTAEKGTVWDIIIDSASEGKVVTVTWAKPQGLLKPGERLVLKDTGIAGDDGQPVQTDVTQASDYVFVSSGEGPRSLSLVLSKEVTESKRSSGGSGFGCGTIRSDRDGTTHTGTVIPGVVLLFSPIVFIRLLRLRPVITARKCF